MQDVGCRMQDVGCRIQDVGCRMQDVGCRIQDIGYRIQDMGYITNIGYQNLDVGYWKLDIQDIKLKRFNCLRNLCQKNLTHPHHWAPHKQITLFSRMMEAFYNFWVQVWVQLYRGRNPSTIMDFLHSQFHSEPDYGRNISIMEGYSSTRLTNFPRLSVKTKIYS